MIILFHLCIFKVPRYFCFVNRSWKTPPQRPKMNTLEIREEALFNNGYEISLTDTNARKILRDLLPFKGQWTQTQINLIKFMAKKVNVTGNIDEMYDRLFSVAYTVNHLKHPDFFMEDFLMLPSGHIQYNRCVLKKDGVLTGYNAWDIVPVIYMSCFTKEYNTSCSQ